MSWESARPCRQTAELLAIYGARTSSMRCCRELWDAREDVRKRQAARWHWIHGCLAGKIADLWKLDDIIDDIDVAEHDARIVAAEVDYGHAGIGIPECDVGRRELGLNPGLVFRLVRCINRRWWVDYYTHRGYRYVVAWLKRDRPGRIHSDTVVAVAESMNPLRSML